MARCDLCGKFKKDCDTKQMQAEGPEWWTECVDCMSDFDKEFLKQIDTPFDDELAKRVEGLENEIQYEIHMEDNT
jgi:hypothetical protein